MAHPTWLRSSRKSMERLGFLKLSVVLGSSSGSSLSDFVHEAREHVDARVCIPYDPAFAQWLVSNGLSKNIEPKDIDTTMQYWWVFNNTPSQTGWLSRLGVPEYFESLPRKTGVLESDFTLSEVGQTLLAGLMSADEVSIWKQKNISSVSPLMLSLGQKVFFIYLLLRTDGDFLLRLLTKMVDQLDAHPFSYLDIGKLIPLVLDEMASSYRGVAYSDDDQREISEIWERRDLIEKQNKDQVEKEGSGSSREQLSIPRLEWLVDVGILQKKESRKYRFTDEGYVLAKALTSYYLNLLSKHYPEDCLSRLLNEHLFGPVVEFLCGNGRRCDRSEYLQLIREAYENLKGPMGYVRLRSILLLMHGCQAERGIPCFMEYNDALGIIEVEHREHPRLVYYTVDRLGDEHQVKFEQQRVP